MATIPKPVLSFEEDDVDALDDAIAFLQRAGRTREAAAVGRLRDREVNGERLASISSQREVSIERAAQVLDETPYGIERLIERGSLRRGSDPAGGTVTTESIGFLQAGREYLAELADPLDTGPIPSGGIGEVGYEFVERMLADARRLREEER